MAARILPAAIARLEAEGSSRSDLLVALGPAVSGDNYPVERDVTLQVAAALRPDGTESEAAAVEEMKACGALREDPERNRDRLDLRAATSRQLQHEGIPPQRITTCPLCTVAEPLLFHSWRRDRRKAVQWSGIVAQA
jgi:copper oxidase (laccase) domain-containing protein